MHTLVQASVTHPCQSRPLVARAIVATVAIFNPAQGRFLFFLLVWRRDIPNVCTSHLLPTSCWATSSTRNRERAREHETIFFYKLHPPPLLTPGADGTHGSSRRTTRTAPQEDLNAPRRSVQRSFRILTTRVGLSPVLGNLSELTTRLRSPVKSPLFFT